MTIVEFYDKTAVENIISTLLCFPDKVIFVGDSAKKMNKSIEVYKKIAEKRNIQVEFFCRSVNRNDLGSIVEALSKIVEENGECVFDLLGGEELYLVAVGMISERYKEKIKLRRFNISSNVLLDCGKHETIKKVTDLELSVDETIGIYGGRIMYESQFANTTHKWNFSNEFCNDIALMWSICKENPVRWNLQTTALGLFSEEYGEEGSLELHVDTNKAKEKIEEKFFFEEGFFRKLYLKGILSHFRCEEGVFSLLFKSEDIKKCLTKAGQVLELFVLITAMNSTDKDGEYVYSDIKTGVHIDWDGRQIAMGTADVTNEIDVILMKGLIPIFISCKNGRNMSVDELYKLSAVADHFGGKYAKKVLVMSELDLTNERGKYIKARTEDMGISYVFNAATISEKEFSNYIKNFWRNQAQS